MKQFYIYAIAILLGIFTAEVGLNLFLSNRDSTQTGISASPSVVLSPSPSPRVIGNPQSVTIPKIAVSAVIEPVAMDSEGRMDIPKRNEDVAWFQPGFKPGESGSAVLAGHLDTSTGAPAVFWDLSKLEAGDEIIVSDDRGKNYRFVVSGKATYKYDKVPVQEVFGKSGEATLNLITCQGSWDSNSSNYSNRTVIFSKLISG
jgi:sortase A